MVRLGPFFRIGTTFGLVLIILLLYLYLRPNSRFNGTVFSSSGHERIRDTETSVLPVQQPLRHTPKIVHLDLKGMPPRVSYLAELFPFLKETGFTVC